MMQSKVLSHSIDGVLVAYDDGHLLKGVLISAPDRDAIAARLMADGAQLIEQGTLTLRLGVALYDRPFVFVPHSIITELGQTLEGEPVFDWLQLKTYDQPRSEVFGLNAHGEEGQIFAREIDLQASPIVVGGPNNTLTYVAGCIGPIALPPRFAACVRILASTEAADVRKAIEAA